MVLDNEHYGETGMQETATRHGVDLAGMAKAAGIADSRKVKTPEEVLALRDAIRAGHGPIFAQVKIDAASPAAGAAAARGLDPAGADAGSHPRPQGPPAMRRRALLLAGAGRAGGGARPRGTASWVPDRPLRLIIPFAAGGSTDVTARLVAQALGERLGQPVVAENRPGAGGNIGAEAAARATPDGYTLLMAVSGILAANRALYRSLPYDSLRDFAPISQVAIIPNLIVVNPDLPVRDIAGLIAYAKAQSGQAELRQRRLRHLAPSRRRAVRGTGGDRDGACAVPRRRAGGDRPDGRQDPDDRLPHGRGDRRGAGRAVAAAGGDHGEALAAAAEVPTVGETLPGFEIPLWNGIVAPAGTPPAAIARLSAELGAALRGERPEAPPGRAGQRADAEHAGRIANYIRAEIPRWAEIVRVSGATAD